MFTKSKIYTEAKTLLQRVSGELVWRSETGSVPLGLHRLPLVKSLKRHMFHLSLMNGEELFVPNLAASFFQHFEETTSRIFIELLKPGMVVVDVGANVGYYTLLASRPIGAEGRVHAFEPSEGTRILLHKNIVRHRLKNVVVHPFAASDRSGNRTFYSTADTGNDGFAIGPYSVDPRAITVVQRRIDELVTGQVDVVKIDIQGSEIEALRGMDGVFAANRSIAVIAEWGPAWMEAAGFDRNELPRFFRERGFQDISAIDDVSGTVMSVEQMLRLFEEKKFHYCNLIAKRH